MACLIYVTILLLLMLHVTPTVLRAKFRRYNHWDGYKCNDGYRSFQIDDRATVLDCARRCSGEPGCSGVFYKRDALCLGCTSQCDVSNTSHITLGSLFYRREVCPEDYSDWVSLPRGCSVIQFRNQSVSHPEAITICASVGAKLVKIDERWKMDSINEVIQNCEDLTTREYWIDGSNADALDFSAPDAWRFSDGGIVPMEKYFWVAHAPNSPETHHCFRIVDGLWDDKHCSFPFWFICEK